MFMRGAKLSLFERRADEGLRVLDASLYVWKPELAKLQSRVALKSAALKGLDYCLPMK